MAGVSSFHQRSGGRELLDAGDVSPRDILATFRFIRFVNYRAGGYRAALKGLSQALHAWPRPKPCRILDVGCGTGEMGPVIRSWGRQSGFDLRYMGVDNNERIIRFAGERCAGPGIEFRRMDLFSPDLPEAECVIASMVLHHLSDGQAAGAIAHLSEKSRIALVINDLLRSPAAYGACWLATLFTANRACRHDALLSIKKGFRENDFRKLLSHRHQPYAMSREYLGRLLLVIFR